MRKLFLFIMAIVCIGMVYSCKSNDRTRILEEAEEEEKEVTLEEFIRGEIFDSPLGTDRERTIEDFLAHGLKVFAPMSTYEHAEIFPMNDSIFYFGNMPWGMLDLEFVNDKFYYITLYNFYEEKAASLEGYEGVLKRVSDIIKMKDVATNDTTELKRAEGFSTQDTQIILSCYRHESSAHYISWVVSLRCLDTKLSKEADEDQE